MYNTMGSKMGHYGASGYVYKAGNHIGTIHADGGYMTTKIITSEK